MTIQSRLIPSSPRRVPIFKPMDELLGSSRKRPSDTTPSDSTPPHPSPSRPLMQHKKRRTRAPKEERPEWVVGKENSSAFDIGRLRGISRNKFKSNGGLTVLCVLGSTVSHIEALSTMIPSLSASCPSISIVGVSLHACDSQYGIPIINDSESRIISGLGFLHPLGGGRVALDAILVFDTLGRRRMTLPVGWGRGRSLPGMVGQLNSRQWSMSDLSDGIRWLEDESEEDEKEDEVGMEIDAGI